MRIASWNINSVRIRQGRLLDWLGQNEPDVLCLQELKSLARQPIEQVERGLQDNVEDPQSRLIAATVAGVRIFSVYAPNGQALDSPAYAYKLEWFQRLRRYLEARQSPADQLVVCGDCNVVPDDRDVYDPVEWANNVLFSLPERAALQELCSFGL